MSADPVWGVGCGWPFQSGEWLAAELAPAFNTVSCTDADLDAGIERYRKRHRRALLGHFLITSDYSTGRRFNPMERLLFAAAARDGRCADGFAAFGGRSVRPNDREFARLVGRAIKVSARRQGGAQLQPLSGAHADGTPVRACVRYDPADDRRPRHPPCRRSAIRTAPRRSCSSTATRAHGETGTTC